jgi:hypothetical protein
LSEVLQETKSKMSDERLSVTIPEIVDRLNKLEDKVKQLDDRIEAMAIFINNFVVKVYDSENE